ncbi:hypothetical protein BDV26DRAFT_197471 [Aspergillus bertholletiae]|uniref:HNH nuclease domain-containing protein n=1 Tax=Aspergillus bertholletiae TaxID=1226010 RepID=A0A5N7B8T1_9EURO|nr:hypothetical protein BDV26DRAFT_197471 [Aspergillus bertholletiae]
MSTPSTQQPPALTSDNAGPAHELLNQERRDLIAQLLRNIGKPQITSIEWACLWFADLERIKRLIKLSEDSEDACVVVGLSLQSSTMEKMAKAWGVRSREPRNAAEADENLGDSGNSPEEINIGQTFKKKRKRGAGATTVSAKEQAGRKAAAKKLSLERDRERCLVTHFHEPIEVAHIYPYSLGNKSQKYLNQFWDVLKHFWSAEM